MRRSKRRNFKRSPRKRGKRGYKKNRKNRQKRNYYVSRGGIRL